MKIKKTIASFLLLAFCLVFSVPTTGIATASTDTETLYDFIKNTKEITASYTYPSMKLAAAGAGKSTLAAHTPIIIRCTETISTRDIVSGGEVNFAVVNDVKDASGNILIKAGSPVTAQISFVKTKGMIGRSGEVTVTDFHTTAVDGTYVPLSGSVSARPDDKMTLSIVLSVLVCPLFLLLKGDDAQVPAGTTKTAYTISEVHIKTVRL